jgi:acetyl esterase
VAGGSKTFASFEEFDGLILSRTGAERFWEAYSSGRDLDQDPFAAPLAAEDLGGLPPALVLVGGCDMLRDEGRAYAERLRSDGTEVAEECFPGQPHGFLNLSFPASVPAFERIGAWLRTKLAAGA